MLRIEKIQEALKELTEQPKEVSGAKGENH